METLFQDVLYVPVASQHSHDANGIHLWLIHHQAVGAAVKVGNIPNETDEVVGVIGQGRGILFLWKRINDEFRSYQRVRPGAAKRAALET